MSALTATKWAGRRLATIGLYVLAITEASRWDDDPDSLVLIAIRLGATATWMMLAVRRTVGHYLEDQKEDVRDERTDRAKR